MEKKLQILHKPANCFGQEEWGKYLGKSEGALLPSNIYETLNGQCPFWSNKKVKDTHDLFLLTRTVNKNLLTLNYLQKLIQQPKIGNRANYKHYDQHVKNELGKIAIPKTSWALMTIKPIPNSRNKSYNSQKNLIEKHAEKSNSPYTIPTALETAIFIVTKYVSSGKIRYGKFTYTRCQEKVSQNKHPVAIGGFNAGKLNIYHDKWGPISSVSAIGAIRKL